MWLKKKEFDGRFLIDVSNHKTANMEIVTFALSMEEDAVSFLTD